MSLSPAFLDELRARVPLQPIVARRVKLTRAGREWKGCCPFHNEKSPSFYVNDDKGFYHCFGCGAHGDVIRFLTEQEGLPFMEAVKQLAAQAGMEVPAASPQAKERAEAGDALSRLAGEAAAWFQQQLASDGGAPAREYLAQRGLNAATIKAFGLGWAPDSRTALRRHFAKVDSAQLLEAGLIGRTDTGEIYDRFRGRVMFPIRDRRGRVVGFGGRAMGDAQPKYLNSADGPLFDKGRLLYNLDQAGPVGRRAAGGAGRIIVVEGYMDVIGLAQAGIAEAVAPLGTAMTEAQLELAWRVADEPILCFDGDSAGKRAALRAATRALPLLQPGKSLRIATLPAGEDPDDLCRRGGGAAFEAVLAEAVPLIDLLWASETAGLEQATPERKAAARARLRAHIGTIADPGIRQLYGAECDRRFEAAFLARPPRAPWQPAPRGQRRGGPFHAPIIPPSDDLKRRVAAGGDSQAQALLAGLLRHPAWADQHEEALAALPLADPGHVRLRDVLLAAAHHLEDSSLDDHLAAAGLAALAAGIRRAVGEGYSFTRDGADAGQAAQDFAAMLDHMLSRHRIGQALAAATARFAETLAEADFATQQALLAEQQAVDAAMMALAQSREDG